MKKPKKEPGTSTPLRQRAEKRLEAGAVGEGSVPSAADAAKLVHELQVHQIELEMQNEELVRSRAEVERALALYSELYEFAPVGYFTLGRDGKIGKVNLTGATLLGTPRSELLGRVFGSFVSDRAALEAMLAAAFAGQEPGSREMALAPQPDSVGLPRFVQLTVNVRGEECLAVAVDVTERRRVEEQLRESHKMEAVGRLAGGVAHDFNNMLTVILSHAELALESTDVDSQLRADLTEVKAAAERSSALTRQLLAFSRRQVLTVEVTDLNELARGLADMLSRLLGERIVLTLELAADLGRVEVDRTHVEQVIMNLIVNARDAMQGAGKVTLTTANVDLDQNAIGQLALKPGRFVVLRVIDTGVGMDASTLRHVFEPLFSTKERYRGTGFGLATVHGIVRQCGGDVAVKSAPQEGSMFEIYLPRVGRPIAPEARSAPRDHAADGTKTETETILVVEDERALRLVTSRVLAPVGYTVLVAGSGEDALKEAAAHVGPIHLVLSDVIMPGMTGPALATRLKALRPETKVLFMSGYAADAMGPGGALAPGVHFIGKPFSPGSLRRKVREVLDMTVPLVTDPP
jgi:two-component system, cell cycle sensor histidine kinase and response regulator CckA